MAEGRRIKEILIDPKWDVGSVLIDGIEFARIMFEHPRHGMIDILLPINEGENLAAILDRVVREVAEKRIKR